jgi:hypothetical protein
MKPSSPIPEPLNPEQTTAAMSRFKKLHKGGSESQYVFNLAELHMLAQLVTELTPDQVDKVREERIGSGVTTYMEFEDIYLSLSPPGKVKFIFKCNVMDKLSGYITIAGTLSASPQGINFSTEKVIIGRLPVLIPPLKDKLLEQVVNTVKGVSDFKDKVASKIIGYTMETDKIILVSVSSK